MNLCLTPILLFFSLILPSASFAEPLTARWLGVAGLVLSDGQTTVFFDPVFTKPSLKNWLTNSEFKSNEELVRKRLSQIGVTRADGIFSSHTHFDHAVDVATVAKITNATVYGGPSLERVVKNHWSDVRFRNSPDDAAIHLGAFTVHTLKRQHSPIFGSWKFQHGDVPANFTSKFYEYREGETWSFYVEHPAGNILIDQGARFFSGNEKWLGRVNVYFVGVANKASFDDLLNANIIKVGAKKVFPLHFDFFLLQSDWLEAQRLPGTGLDKIEPYLRLHSPSQQFIIPARDEVITLP